jgi:hypothetical protein
VNKEPVMPYPDSDEEIEISRQERLRELRESARLGGTAPRGINEAVNTAAALMKSVDDGLAGHPVVAANPDLYRLAYRAFENLFELHRAMGGEHPPAVPERSATVEAHRPKPAQRRA